MNDNKSSSNPSLITARFPSDSIMTSRLIQPSSTTKQNYYLNQNRATDTQPISLNSQKSDTSQSITLSHRTTSDIYLNLSRKDIDDLMTALHTLAQHVQNDLISNNGISTDDNQSHPLTMLHSKSTNHTIKSSSEVNNCSHYHCYHPPPPPRYSIRNRRRSLSSDRWLDHHHVKHYLNLVEEFQHEVYDIKRKQERRLLRQLQYYQNHFNHQNSSSYPSYSSNVILQSTKNLPSLISLSSYIHDQFIYIDQNESISNIQMLPQQTYTLQILQNSHIPSFMSIDSLNTKGILHTALKPCRLQKINHDQMNFNKIDVATQWSLQVLTPKSISSSTDDQEHSKLDTIQTNSTILTELSQSRTTIATNNSAVHTPLIKSLLDQNDEHDLTSVNLPTCKCLNTKRLSTNDTTTCITLDDDNELSSTPLNKKKIKRTAIKLVSKRPRHHHPSKSSKNNPTPKRFRSHRHSQSNNRLMTIIQSLKTTDLQEDSSFDFFDVDTTFSDAYDRFFSDTIIS